MTLTPEPMVAQAEALARRYHAGAVDRVGVDYIRHPEAVVGYLAGTPALWRAVAWLHDVLEHTAATAEDLASEGVPPEVIRVVKVLSRPGGEDYLEFINRVCTDPVAVRVKIADTLHNLDPARHYARSAEQRAKYHEGLVRLVKALPAG